MKDDPTDAACSLTTPNAFKQVVAIPAGTTYAASSLFDDFVDGDGDDLDLCVVSAGGHGRREQRRRDGERDCQHREPGGR